MPTATEPPLTLAAVDPGKLYTPAEVAAVFRRQAETVEKWCRAGRVKAEKVFGRYLIAGSEVQRLYGEQILASRVPAPASQADLERRYAAILERIAPTRRKAK